MAESLFAVVEKGVKKDGGIRYGPVDPGIDIGLHADQMVWGQTFHENVGAEEGNGRKAPNCS